MTQCIRLLSDPHGNTEFEKDNEARSSGSASPFAKSDPFSSAELTYSTNNVDSYPAPSAYPTRRFSWVHIFPEGMTHQHPDKVMRYFKWGVARLILEAEPCPDVVPMWIDGPQHVMDNERGWPKPFPRFPHDIRINFGELVDNENVFEPFRQKWREMKERARRKRLAHRGSDKYAVSDEEQLGVLVDDDLKFSKEVEQLRIAVTLAVRDEVLKVRKACSDLPDEDPKRSLADSFREEGELGPDGMGRKRKDGSSTKDV